MTMKKNEHDPRWKEKINRARNYEKFQVIDNARKNLLIPEISTYPWLVLQNK